MIEAWDEDLEAKREAAEPRFCQQCGTARPEGARFCPSCGRPFADRAAQAAPPTSLAPVTTPAAATMAPAAARTDLAVTLAGVAWMGVALVGGYLAYLQWTFSPYAGAGEASLQSFALVNTAAAVVTLVFAALLLAAPSRGRLTASIVWGVLSVAGGVIQMAGGATHWTIFVGTAGAAVAAVLAWVARNQHPGLTD